MPTTGPGTARAPRARAVGPELVFAVVSPVGTPAAEFHKELAGNLLAYGYRTETVKLSRILADQAAVAGRPVPAAPESDRVGALMDEGDRLCAEYGQAAAVALLGVEDLRELRADLHESGGLGRPREELQDLAVERTAFVLDSVKRPAEVLQLRWLYGDHLILIGLQAKSESRVRTLVDQMTPQRASLRGKRLEGLAEALVDRDLTESDDFGQNVLRAFPLADVFVDVDADVGQQVSRFLDLLFDSPEFPVPSGQEYGMHLAHVSSTRSPELGLKVGAAVLRADMTVVSLGVNAHPVPSGSPAFDASAVDIRGLVIDALSRLGEEVLRPEALERLRLDPDGYAEYVLRGPLKAALVGSITEFQPTVHAEMDALLGAVKRGQPVEGTVMYVTAYPCHNCAKHLVSLGLRVVYLEPYPKSRAAAMYGTSVLVSFVPFVGVAPRRYQRLFETSDDRKTPDGSRKPWTPLEKQRAHPKVDPFVDQRGIADRERTALAALDRHVPAGPGDPGAGNVGGGGQDGAVPEKRPADPPGRASSRQGDLTNENPQDTRAKRPEKDEETDR